MNTHVDVLAVMDAEIAALPQMAFMASVHGVECDPEEAVRRMTEARAAVAELIEADQEAIDTLDSLIHAMELPMPDALHMKALRAALPRLLELKRTALTRVQGGSA